MCKINKYIYVDMFIMAIYINIYWRYNLVKCKEETKRNIKRKGSKYGRIKSAAKSSKQVYVKKL